MKTTVRKTRVSRVTKGQPTHPGFKAVQAKIARKPGITMEGAGAILASATRKASPKAKAKNPMLKKVKMPKKK